MGLNFLTPSTFLPLLTLLTLLLTALFVLSETDQAPPSPGRVSKPEQIKVAHSFTSEKYNPLLIITLKCDKCCNRGMNWPLGKQGAGMGWQEFLAGDGKASEKWNLCLVS